jgi:hypothetical protein
MFMQSEPMCNECRLMLSEKPAPAVFHLNMRLLQTVLTAVDANFITIVKEIKHCQGDSDLTQHMRCLYCIQRIPKKYNTCRIMHMNTINNVHYQTVG